MEKAIEKNFEESNKYDYKKDCPMLQFGDGDNLKNEDEFFKMLDEYFKKVKNIEVLFDAFEKDKKNKSIEGIKKIVNKIEILKEDLFKDTTDVENHCKVEFTNTQYNCRKTQAKIKDLIDKILQLKDYINKLSNLINSKSLKEKVNKINNISENYELFNKKLKIFIPEEKPSNKTIDFSDLNEKSDLLKLPIISIVNNSVICSCSNLKLNFGPFISSLYSNPIKINFTSLVKNLSMNIKDIDNQYIQLIRGYVDNSNGLALLEITIPKMENKENDNELIRIKCKLEFNSPGFDSCLLDCEFNIEIIPFNSIIYCKEYDIVKNNSNNNSDKDKKIEDYHLCLSKILTGSSIHFYINNYNINKECNYTYQLKSLENNTTSEKPEIIKGKDNLEIVLGKKNETSIQRLVCQLIIIFSNTMNIKINIDCFLIPFDFKFEIYDYNTKKFNNVFKVFLRAKYDEINGEVFIRPKTIPLHFQVIFPLYPYKGNFEFSYSKNKYISLRTPMDFQKSFDKSFNFNLDLIIDANIITYVKDIKTEFKEKSIDFFIKIMNLKKTVNVTFDLFDEDKFKNLNKFGLEKYIFNAQNKWELVTQNYSENSNYNGTYVSMFGLEYNFNLDYNFKYRQQNFWSYIDYQSIKVDCPEDNNKILFMEIGSKFLFFTQIKYYYEEIYLYNYDKDKKIGILGYLGDSTDFWYPVFSNYNDIYLKINNNTKNGKLSKYKDKLNQIKESTKKIYKNDIYDFSILALRLAILGSEWKAKDSKIELSKLLNEILKVLKGNANLKNIYDLITKNNIKENDLDKAYYDTIMELYQTFKQRYELIKRYEYIILSEKLSPEKINKKSDELLSKYFYYQDNFALNKDYVIKTFEQINKGIKNSNEIMKSLEKLPKSKAIVYKEGGKILLSDKTDTNFELSKISQNKGEDLAYMNKFKTDLIQDLIYPPVWSISSLNDFFMKSIKLTRELPLFAISAKLENNTIRLRETEKLFIKLLDLYENTPEKNDSLISELIITFNEQFTKMTNNLLKSNIIPKEGTLPNKLKIDINESIQSKQYVIIPKQDNINEIPEIQWESNSNHRIKYTKKNELSNQSIIITKSVSNDNINNVNNDLLREKEKREREEDERKRKENQKLLEKERALKREQSKIFNSQEEKEEEQKEEEQQKEEKIKKEDLISNFKIKFKINRKASKDKIINLNKNDKNEINDDTKKDFEVNIDTSIKKQYIKLDVSNFNFNDELLLRLVIERMKEIEDKIKNNKLLPELGIKKGLKGQPDYRNEKPSSMNFNVIGLYERGMSLANKIVKNISEKSVPFSHISVNLLLDCSGFINIENKLKQFIIVCGIINALNIVNIEYAISLVGDSQFECTLKPFDLEHSIENLQKILDCLFIKRFIGKNANAIQYALKLTNAYSTYRTILMFTDGLDEDFLLTEAWKNKLFTNPNFSFGFFFINSENICNRHSEELDYLRSKWNKFKKNMRDSGINIDLLYYESTFQDSNKLYDKIAKIVSNLLYRPIDEEKTKSKEDVDYIAPTFDLSHEKNLESIDSFERALEYNYENRNDIFIKKTDVLKNITNKVNKLDVNPYKNKLSKIIKYDFKDEKIKSDVHSFAKKYIENRAKLNKAKIETIFKPNKPSQKVLSTTGTEFDIPALIMNLINPSPDPMIYLEEKGGMIRNYSVTLILDTSYSCFNSLCNSFSLQTLRLMLSTLTSIDIPCFDMIISRQKEPEILCSNLSSVRAINPKSNLWESLLSIIATPCSKSDIASALEAAFDLKRMRSSEYTSYLFILTDGLYQENEHKRILKAVSNCVKSGLNIFCIGIGIYPIRIELLFPKVIYCHNPYNINKAIANFFGESISGNKDSMAFMDLEEKNHESIINEKIKEIITNNLVNLNYKNLNQKLSEVLVETDAFLLISNQEDDMEDTHNEIKSNPTGEGKELLKKDRLKGQKILIVMLWSKTLNSEENESVHKDYLTKVSSESEVCLKDALDHLGVIIEVVENYRNAIEKITSKDKKGKCPYYAVWIINGPPYEDLPDNSKESFLLGQFLEVLKIFWENGGALVFLAEGWKLQYQTNEFLKMLDFDGKKVDFYLVGDDEEKGTKEHIGGKILTGDVTGLLKEKKKFSKKIERYGGIQRLRLDHNLFNLFEGDTICYTNTDDYNKLLPFHPFSRDSDNGISSLFYLSDDKKRGDIFIDCGFTKLFINMKKDDTAYRYFQNIASWSARTEMHLVYDGIDARDWRPNSIDYTIDINKKWDKFLIKTTGFKKIDRSKLSTLFAFDNSGSVKGKIEYFNEIDRIVKKYYKPGDKFYLWETTYTEKSKPEIEEWIKNKKGHGGTDSENIAKLIQESPNHREHLIIVTDGEVPENCIKKCDDIMSQSNIQFKFISVYVVGTSQTVNLSVGAPFCRACPNKTIQVIDANNRIRGPTLSLDEIAAFNQIPNINSINQFNTLFNKLFSVIKAKQLGKNCDNDLVIKLNDLNSRIINNIHGQEKVNFENKWKQLYKMALNGVHDLKIGTAGIKKTK